MVGSLDDSKILEEEAAKADVVIRKSWNIDSIMATQLTVHQTRPMPLTMKAQQRQSLKASHPGTRMRSLDSGCTQAVRAFCAGRRCVTTRSSARGRNASITTGLLWAILPAYQAMHSTRTLTMLCCNPALDLSRLRSCALQLSTVSDRASR